MARTAYTYKMTGLKEVQGRLTKEILKIRGRSKAGLWAAGLNIKAEAQRLCPVDTGNLKGSAYTTAFDTLLGPSVEIGFTAEYAVDVHEHNRNYRNGEWKFLETAMKVHEKDIPKLIRSYQWY